MNITKRRPVRRWYVSPAGFVELRRSCGKACAAYLGASPHTYGVRHWETGRQRVPWSTVRRLRLLRCGDLGALSDEWAGWTINRFGLHAPTGQTCRERNMRG
jgi:hypothetical protein